MLKYILVAVLFCSCSRAPKEEQNPLGIVFECRKVQEVEVPDVGSVAITGFQVQNVSPGQWYYLKRVDYYGCVKTLFTFYSDAEGRLLAVKNHEVVTTLDDLKLIESNAGLAKRSIYWLVSKDGTTAVHSSYIPYEIRAVACDGASISLESIYDNSLVAIHATGFSPNESLLIRGTTDEQMQFETQCVCSSEPEIVWYVDPRIVGKTSGTAMFEVIRESGEILKITYEWGPKIISNTIMPSSKIPLDVVKKGLK